MLVPTKGISVSFHGIVLLFLVGCLAVALSYWLRCLWCVAEGGYYASPGGLGSVPSPASDRTLFLSALYSSLASIYVEA